MSLEGKIVLVTGASRGIGAAIASELAECGAFVIGTATSAAGAEGIAAKLGATGTGVVLDVCDAAGCAALIAQIEADHGGVDVLVNNAGITRDNLLLRLKDSDIDAVMQTNLLAVFRLSKLVLRPMMKKRSGRIISITSVVGAIGNAGQSNYAAAKAGVVGFSKSLAREVGSRGITVNVVAPGFVDTDMTRSLSEQQRADLSSTIALGRLGEAGDIAAAVAFLASDRAAYITGETLHVNGGMYMA